MDEPTKIIDGFGNTQYRLNGKIHRTDGPAVVCTTGSKYWYANNMFHRTDGPAIERTDGSKEWWVANRCISMKNYQDYVHVYPDLMNQFLVYQALIT